MNAMPVADVCANCGAPLDLDEAGACRWCHAHIRTERAALSISDFDDLLSLMPDDDQLSLVPDDVDDCTSTPTLFLTLSTLGPLLSTEPAVRQYMRGEPRLLEQIRALSTAVSAAGVRVRDAGLVKDDFIEDFGLYTPEEIWTFDLAFDVIALIGALDGLPGRTKAEAASNLRLLDEDTGRHVWKNAMKKAGKGPVTFQDLRARVPHRG